MIDRARLLADLQKLLQRLEADLLERSESAEVPEVGAALRAEFARAKAADRTAQNFEDWRTDAITQAAAAWVLSCVFVRFLEDNRLIEPPRIAGSDERLQRARDEHELFFRAHPTQTDRDYLLALFDPLAARPATRDLFGEHNPLRELPNWLSGDAAGELLRFFQRIEPDTGRLVHDFTDPQWDTRFLGDLYQDLSEAARKKFALLQTPEFVEEFILDRTLDPALDHFGLVLAGATASDASARGSRKKSAKRADSDRDADVDGDVDAGVDGEVEQEWTSEQLIRLIDPACGSGHFLLGAFRRLLARWQRREPGTSIRVLVQRTLDSLHGVDVNPFAIAIARFRLLLAAMRASGVERLAGAPSFRLHLACGDSLLHAPLKDGQKVLDFELVGGGAKGDDAECEHAYQSEDLPQLKRILRGGRYHAVVANPPYITPKDRLLNDRYRKRFHSCHMKYSLSVPFLERIFQLATPDGFTGQITANSFMKREFGKKLIESYLPTIDLTHVIDTSGAYIPGHGTPTVILFGRQRAPVSSTLRTVLGIRGEPATPDEPAKGLVWTAIVDQIDQEGSQSEFVSVGDSARALFHRHPWSIGGGGASELKERLDTSNGITLVDAVDEIGILGMTNADEVMLAQQEAFLRRRVERMATSRIVLGDEIRDWKLGEGNYVVFPYYGDQLADIGTLPGLHQWLWPSRTVLGNRATFARLTYFQEGRPWWEWHQVTLKRLQVPLSITFAEVATHNHFVLDRGGKIFNRTAPVIKLPREASEDDYLALLGLLNSSTACFWMKQVCFPKGGDHVGQEGARVRRTAWDERYAFNGTNLGKMPLPNARPLGSAQCIESNATQYLNDLPSSLNTLETPSRKGQDQARSRCERTRSDLIFLQEELDWECYHLYGLSDSPLTYAPTLAAKDSATSTANGACTEQSPFVGLELGQRAFEIVLARKMAAGELQTTWFERHGSTPITELPAHWPADYRKLVEQRIALIESDANIRLIEQPEYKRRWNTEPWESQVERALRQWLLNRLESYFDFDGRMREATGSSGSGEGASGRGAPPLADIQLVSLAQLSDVARQDPEFQQVGALYRDDEAFDVLRLVEQLVLSESVPLLPVLRYKPSGLRKRQEWESTWALQREQDQLEARRQQARARGESGAAESGAAELAAIPADPEIAVPPHYTSADFLTSAGTRYWALRGKLDVPKERWLSFPHCAGPDGTLMICWAGYDHLQQARAISSFYVRVQNEFGGSDDPRLVPLLACMQELIPWLLQWHNAPSADFDGMRMGEYFEGFVAEEARHLGQTLPEIRRWTPPAKSKSRK